MRFIRKVYTILATQLSITAAFILFVQLYRNTFVDFMIANVGITIFACVGSIITSIMIICCFGRSHPTNYVLLFIFTICETYMVGGITAGYEPKIVMMAGAATAAATIALTVYAMRTKKDIEVFMALAFVVYLAILPIMIICIFIRIEFLYTLYLCLGIVLYSLYLIIDTMYICKGASFSGRECNYDDHIIGALMLYIDIIMLFIYILRLLGKK